MVKTAVEVRTRLKELGFSCSIINSRFVKPIDEEVISEFALDHTLFVTMEENVLSGGYGEKVLRYLNQTTFDCKLLSIAIPDEYVEHGNPELLKKEIGIDANGITERILKILNHEK